MARQKTKVHHPLFARLYLKFADQADSRGGAEHPDRLLAGLSGRVIEVGAGQGGNFAHYPAAVEEVLAVEPEPLLRERAAPAARSGPVRVEVVDGVAEALPADDGSFDAAAVSLVLCTVPDQADALAEIHAARGTGAAIERAGFEIERCGRFPFRAGALAPAIPHILGTARRVRSG